MSFLESIFYMAWRGIAIGLIISAPMGPVGMLCIQRTLDKGRRAGLFTGIGAAISDLFYSLLTGFGLSFIEEFLERNSNVIQLAGSAVLIAFGIYLFRKNPTHDIKKPIDTDVSVRKSILGGFLFTFSNPLILFLIIGLFARFNFLLTDTMAHQHFSWFQYVVIYVVGYAFIFIGALLWWWFITFSIDKVRSHFNLRSMWWINKIIGSIILLFAIVGIYTATAALVQGADIRCWNESRGFGPFGDEKNINHLSNSSKDTVYFFTPCQFSESLEFRCKVKNNKPSLPWGFFLGGENGQKILINIRAHEGAWDGISTHQTLDIDLNANGEILNARQFIDDTNLYNKLKSGMKGPDPSGSLNFFKIVSYNGLLSLLSGLQTPAHVFSEKIPDGFRCSRIGFFLPPGSAISPDEVRLSTGNYSAVPTIWYDDMLLKEYLSDSRDFLEGYWQPLDRSLEESLIRLGGNYRFAMVRNEDGYDLLYLSGAQINADSWKPGMVKATLRPSGISGIWDVAWIDSMFQTLNKEIKAQTDANGTLTISFPYQSSHIRLHHSSSDTLNVIPQAKSVR